MFSDLLFQVFQVVGKRNKEGRNWQRNSLEARQQVRNYVNAFSDEALNVLEPFTQVIREQVLKTSAQEIGDLLKDVDDVIKKSLCALDWVWVVFDGHPCN